MFCPTWTQIVISRQMHSFYDLVCLGDVTLKVEVGPFRNNMQYLGGIDFLNKFYNTGYHNRFKGLLVCLLIESDLLNLVYDGKLIGLKCYWLCIYRRILWPHRSSKELFFNKVSIKIWLVSLQDIL